MLEKLRLDGPPRRVAIVTGGSRGLGREMARSLAMAGADVCIAARGQERLEETRDWIAAESGREVLAVPTDIRLSESCDALVGATVERFGRLDILVNNAGIGDAQGMGRGIAELAEEDWRDGIDVNLSGTFYCTRAAVRHWKQAGHGASVLNISSGMGLRGAPNSFTYGAAKAGVVSLTQSFAMELAKDGVRVNCIVPGFVAQMPPENDREREANNARGRFLPSKRTGEAWELGPLAVFLCSDAASYITGESIPLDGGGLAGGIAPLGWPKVAGSG